MSAFACLRVELPQALADRAETLREPLQRIVRLYLEMRWSWPRRFSPLDTLGFLLADPRIEHFDASELCRLANELGHHLFGADHDSGEVSLLLFEGTPKAVDAFSAFGPEDVVAAIADPELLPAGGRLTRIRAGAAPVVEAVGPPLETPANAAKARAPQPKAPPATRPAPSYVLGVTGTYMLSREMFVADLLALDVVGEAHHFTTIESKGLAPPDEAAFDEICFRGVAGMLPRKVGGLPLGVPVAYSHFAGPEQVHRLQQMLTCLPAERRSELNASVYVLPHHLPGGVAQLHPVLDPYFRTINLVTSDPAFEIEHVDQAIGCVVFCVREISPKSRYAAMRLFAGRHEAYRRRGIPQVLANLRTPAELDLARRLDIQLVSGPAVSGFLETPMGGRGVALSQLPIRRAPAQAVMGA